MIQIISHNLYPAEHTEFLLYQTKFKMPSKLLSELFVMTLTIDHANSTKIRAKL